MPERVDGGEPILRAAQQFKLLVQIVRVKPRQTVQHRLKLPVVYDNFE